ncbi:MAG: HU family DNA-binding protein [Bacteroidaceae bacterium]|nr:HU family DNA-binding protein [Bacteroidaceae bacterium]
MLYYKNIIRKNPKTEQQLHYATLVSPQPVSRERIIERIEKKCTLSSADVKAVLDALEFELIDFLQEGCSVRLGDVGTFRLSISSAGATKPEDVKSGLIRGARVVYTPSTAMRRRLSVKGGLKFARWTPEAAAEATQP